MLLRKIDRLTGLTKQVAKRLADDRVRGRCEHTQLSLLRQRVYALAIGDEDLNDHQQLRHDLALQSAIDRDRASSAMVPVVGRTLAGSLPRLNTAVAVAILDIWLRDIGLRGTGYAKAQVGTIRLTLLKIGAVIIRNTRKIKFFLSGAYPHQQLFCQVVARLDTS